MRAVGVALLLRNTRHCFCGADTKQRIREQTRAAMQRPDVQAKLRRSHPPHSEETKVRCDPIAISYFRLPDPAKTSAQLSCWPDG